VDKNDDSDDDGKEKSEEGTDCRAEKSSCSQFEYREDNDDDDDDDDTDTDAEADDLEDEAVRFVDIRSFLNVRSKTDPNNGKRRSS
jgi:hypothetical protein